MIPENFHDISDDANNAFVDSMAQRFMGKDRYDLDPPGEARVVVTITPGRVRGQLEKGKVVSILPQRMFQHNQPKATRLSD